MHSIHIEQIAIRGEYNVTKEIGVKKLQLTEVVYNSVLDMIKKRKHNWITRPRKVDFINFGNFHASPSVYSLKALNFLQSDRCCPRIESGKVFLSLIRFALLVVGLICLIHVHIFVCE